MAEWFSLWWLDDAAVAGNIMVITWLTKDTKRASRTEFGYALLILTHIDLPLLGRHPPPKHFWKWYPKRHPKHQLIL